MTDSRPLLREVFETRFKSEDVLAAEASKHTERFLSVYCILCGGAGHKFQEEMTFVPSNSKNILPSTQKARDRRIETSVQKLKDNVKEGKKTKQTEKFVERREVNRRTKVSCGLLINVWKNLNKHNTNLAKAWMNFIQCASSKVKTPEEKSVSCAFSPGKSLYKILATPLKTVHNFSLLY